MYSSVICIIHNNVVDTDNTLQWLKYEADRNINILPRKQFFRNFDKTFLFQNLEKISSIIGSGRSYLHDNIDVVTTIICIKKFNPVTVDKNDYYLSH